MARFLARLAAGLVALAPLPAAATIVDVSATSPDGTTLSLAAGRYEVAVVGIAGGGAYDAYSLWSHQYAWDDPRTGDPCLGDGSQCRYGYQDEFVTTIDGQSTLYRLAADAAPASPGYFRYTTASAAAAAAIAGPYETLLGFTLAGPKAVTFRVNDSSWWDNDGGVSLRVTAVPEPADWLLMTFGLGLVGAGARRRGRAVVTA